MKLLRGTVEDLRERRLWPVALVLAVALIVVPLVLLGRGGGDAQTASTAPADAGPTPSSTSAAGVTAVADSRQSLQTRLRHFNDKDPFKPQGEKSSSGSDSTGDSLGAAGAGTSNGSGSTTGSDTGTGGSTGNGNGSTTGSDTETGGEESSGTVVYTVDVKIDSKTYKDAKPGKALPSSDDPLVVYAGTETGSKQRADFFLANGLSVQYGKGATYVAETDMLKLEENAVVYITKPDGKEYTLSVTGFGTTTVSQSGTSSSAHR